MKRTTILTAIVLASGVAVFAQDAPMAKDFQTGEVTVGVGQNDVDNNSSKYLEYREIPNGVVAPYLRLFGQKDNFRYELLGGNVQQRDAFYRLKLGNEKWRLEGNYVAIPHNFGNDGHTLLQNTDPAVWQLSDTTQAAYQSALEAQFKLDKNKINYTFLNNLVSPGLAAANEVDLGLDRQRGNLVFRLTPDKPLDIRLTYFHEKRSGDRSNSGTSFGFSNVVELPEFVQYVTQDIGATAQYEGSWGVARAAIRYNWFENSANSFAWDNPFRVTDSTDSSAYQAPGSGSVNGPSFGRMALPPDNDAFTGSAGATLKFSHNTRLSADVSIGSWKQNSTPFIPYTTNTAIQLPDTTVAATDAAALPARQLDGKADVTSFNAAFTSTPADKLHVTAHFRRYDLDNKTGRISFPYYIRFDAAFEDIPRITVPYGFTNTLFDATVGYDLGDVTLEGGYRNTGFDRTFRETEKTKENAFTVAANWRGKDWAIVRASYEHGNRDFDGLEIERSEDASFQQPGAPTNLLATDPGTPQIGGGTLCAPGTVCNLRYDQAKRKFDRFLGHVELTPTDKVTVGLAYVTTKYNYDESTYGLTESKYDSFTVDADYTPSAKWNVYAFYTYEKNRDAQRGRQSGSSVSTNPLDDWTSDVNDKGNTVGGGFHYAIVPDKWTFDFGGHYQKVDGNNAIGVFPGGVPYNNRVSLGGAQSLPLYDDTKITSLNASLRYQFAKKWSAGLSGWFEDYTIKDSNTAGLLNYVPGSFFLAANDGDYQAKWAYLYLTYRW
jgi:MtrB/PioB family decaheme-associated outer membrane protein